MISTFEQLDIENSDSKIIKIFAFAGTGKTTTLVNFSKKRQNKKFIYIALNESIVKSSINKFGNNVKIMTYHALAYRSIGKYYEKKLCFNIELLKVVEALLMPKISKNFKIAKILTSSFEKYFNSEFINVSEVYNFIEDDYKNLISKNSWFLYIERLWELMLDMESNFPITHGFYLKLYHLSDMEIDYDYILFDESQDCIPVVKRIIYNQLYKSDDISAVFTGDKHQNINSFMGTENIFDDNELNSQKFYLTKSFRFGNNIANMANKLLSLVGEEKKIKGNEDIADNLNFIDSNYQYAIICRTNAMVVGYALAFANKNKKIHIIGEDKLNFGLILDIYYLKKGEFKKILNPRIKKFKTILGLENHAKIISDDEILFSIKSVKNISEDLHYLIKELKNRTVDNINSADIIISNTHKVKGLEFEQVVLANDFVDLFDKNNKIKENLKHEEISILYVAMTRAIRNLKLNNTLNELLNYEKNS